MKSKKLRNAKNRDRLIECLTLSLVICIFVLCACGKKEFTPAVKSGAKLYLAQAQFFDKKNTDGTLYPVPGPARLVIWTKIENGWDEDVLEDVQSNVFHKAAWFAPVQGEPGILTIGGTQAALKIWRRQKDIWTEESLWNPTFGGEIDRLRDFEVADVTGNGLEDIVIATHDQGVVAVLTWNGKAYQPEELCRKPDTFVHEIEVGDIDRDGILEIFCTPSQPNKLAGSIQTGEILMFKFSRGRWLEHQIDRLQTRHAKEILCATLPDEDKVVLFAALEGERISNGQAGDSTRIRMYRFASGQVSKENVAGLPGRLCRFLTFGDTDGDKTEELIVSANGSGIWKLSPPEKAGDGQWKKELVAMGSSGFEHATFLADLNGDGTEEIYVASDDQQELRCYWFDGVDYSVEVIGKLKEDTITFGLTAYQFVP